MLSSISKSVGAGAAIGLVSVLVSFAPARAVPVNVSYAIQLSYFSPSVTPPVLQGTGALTVQFANGTAGGHVSAGPLHVVSGTAMLTNNVVIVPGQLSLSGSQLVIFGGSGVGAVTGGGLFTLNTVGHIASGFVHCQGSAFFCSFAAGFPLSVPQNLASGMQTLHVTAGALVGFPSLGPQTMFGGAGTGMSPMGGTLLTTVTGNEVGVRQVVPEPGTGLLLGFGLAGFGIAATSWRARRRRA